MKKLSNQRGYAATEIAIAVIVIFIFTTLIATLIYSFNSQTNEMKFRTEATNIAVEEIEKLKNAGLEPLLGMNKDTTTDKEGKSLVNQPVEGKEGYYRTIKIYDYKDLNNAEEIERDLVKKVTVIISYKFKGKEQKVEISTSITKEI